MEEKAFASLHLFSIPTETDASTNQPLNQSNESLQEKKRI